MLRAKKIEAASDVYAQGMRYVASRSAYSLVALHDKKASKNMTDAGTMSQPVNPGGDTPTQAAVAAWAIERPARRVIWWIMRPLAHAADVAVSLFKIAALGVGIWLAVQSLLALAEVREEGSRALVEWLESVP